MSRLQAQLGRLTPEHRELLESLLGERGLALDHAAGSAARRYPLSKTQERLWMSGTFAPRTAFGNLPLALWITGPLEEDALRRAIAALVRRQETLRTVYPVDRGVASQLVLPPTAPVAFTVENVDAGTREEARRQALERAHAEALRPFALEHESPFRAFTYRVAPTEHLLLLVTHHLATDGWGIRILLSELAAGYSAAVSGLECPAVPLPMSYATWSVEQRRWLESPAANEAKAYWDESLRGAPRILPLPYDRMPSGRPSLAAGFVDWTLPDAVADGLRALSRTVGSTPFTTLCAAFSAALYKATGQEDLVVGTIISTRSRVETEQVVGNFGNNVLLRLACNATTGFDMLVRRVHQAMSEAHAHALVPLESVLERRRARSDLEALPLFQAVFLLREGDLSQHLKVSGWSVTPVTINVGLSTVDLVLDVTDRGTGLGGALEYRTALFEPGTAEDLCEDARQILERAVTSPSSAVAGARLPKRPTPAAQRARTVAAEHGAGSPSPVENLIAGIWRNMLGSSVITPLDNFFDLGGDSLQAMTVIEQIERETGRRLSPLDLSSQTLRQVAVLCGDGAQAATPRGWRG